MNVRITLNDNQKFEAYLEGFVLADFINDINQNTHQMIQFGNKGIAKHTIKIVEDIQGSPPSA